MESLLTPSRFRQGAATVASQCPTDRVAVVVLNFNGTEDTLRCLNSLRAVEFDNLSVTVIDNGSQPAADGQIAAAHPWVDVVRCEENGGWAGGNNVGIRRALDSGAQHVILLNNDTVVEPQFVARLLEAAGTHPAFGILGPLVTWMDEPDAVMMDGCTFDDPADAGFFLRQVVPVAVAADGSPVVREVEIVYGCCLMVLREVFESIGLIDERFFLIHEESDFCLRARAAGFRCGVVAEPLVRHKGSSTFEREPKPLKRYYDARNLALLLRKHGRSYSGDSTRRQRRLKYLKHVYYMYCLEREAGRDAGAQAVLEGFSDGLLRRYGPLRDRLRPLVPVVRRLFERRRRTRRGKQEG